MKGKIIETVRKIKKNKYKVYPVYYPVGNGIFNINKSIEDIKWILENEINILDKVSKTKEKIIIS